MKASFPPPLAEKLLARWIPPDIRGAVLGDLSEVFVQLATRHGRIQALAWYWFETFRAIPNLRLYSLEISNPRRRRMIGDFFHQQKNWSAAIGAILVLPAAFLVIVGLMYSFGSREIGDLILTRVYSGEWYWRVAHPVFVLGGLFLTLAANSLSVASLKIDNAGSTLTVAVELEKNRWNFAILGLTLLLALILAGYAVGENVLAYL